MPLRFNITAPILATDFQIKCNNTIRISIDTTNMNFEQSKFICAKYNEEIQGKIFDGSQQNAKGYLCDMKLYESNEEGKGVFLDFHFPNTAPDPMNPMKYDDNIPKETIELPIFISKCSDVSMLTMELKSSAYLHANIWKVVEINYTFFDKFCLSFHNKENPISLHIYYPNSYDQYSNMIVGTVQCCCEFDMLDKTKPIISLLSEIDCILKDGTILSMVNTQCLQYGSQVLLVDDF